MKEIIPINSEYLEHTLLQIGAKWKINILYFLYKNNVMRYGELKKSVGNITHKMLSKQLKELEQDFLIIRKEYSQIPPKVEYMLSEKGMTLMPILHLMCSWGEEHKGKKYEPFSS